MLEHLQELWEKPTIQVQRLLDTIPSEIENATVSLWDLGNQLASSLREVAANHVTLAEQAHGGNLSTHRDYFFVNNNLDWNFFNPYQTNMDGLTMRAMEQIEKVNKMKLVLLVIEVIHCFFGAHSLWHAQPSKLVLCSIGVCKQVGQEH
jgi:hypothetical protein